MGSLEGPQEEQNRPVHRKSDRFEDSVASRKGAQDTEPAQQLTHAEIGHPER
jgi:hypothetical protein